MYLFKPCMSSIIYKKARKLRAKASSIQTAGDKMPAFSFISKPFGSFECSFFENSCFYGIFEMIVREIY